MIIAHFKFIYFPKRNLKLDQLKVTKLEVIVLKNFLIKMFFIISIGKEIKKVLLTKKKKLVSNDRYKNIV